MTELEINMIQFWPVYRSVEILSNLRITTEWTDFKSLNILATVFLLSNGRGTALNVYTKPKFTYLGTFFTSNPLTTILHHFVLLARGGLGIFPLWMQCVNSLSNFTMWNKVKWFFLHTEYWIFIESPYHLYPIN